MIRALKIAICAALCACGQDAVEAPPAGNDRAAAESESGQGQAYVPPPADDPFTIVFYGDSLFAGYLLAPDQSAPAAFERAFTHPQGVSVQVVNAGRNGASAQKAVDRFARAVPPEADLVLIEFGANDLFRGRPAEDLRADLQAIAEKARALGAQPVIVGLSAPPRGVPAPPTGVFASAAAAACAPLYPFYFNAIIDETGRNLDGDMLLPDGLHPNAEGAEAIGRDLAAWLELVLARPLPCMAGPAAP